jgi:hypothetical protein
MRWALTPPFHPYSLHIPKHMSVSGIFLLHYLLHHCTWPLASELWFAAPTFLNWFPNCDCPTYFFQMGSPPTITLIAIFIYLRNTGYSYPRYHHGQDALKQLDYLHRYCAYAKRHDDTIKSCWNHSHC